MQSAIGDAVGRLEAPAGKDRLHDLEAVRDPADRFAISARLMPGVEIRFQAEHDFGLDARLRQMR